MSVKCVHHWLIEREPEDRAVDALNGTCKKCAATKTFPRKFELNAQQLTFRAYAPVFSGKAAREKFYEDETD